MKKGKERLKVKKVFLKIVLVNLMNFILILAILLLLRTLPSKALEVKELRNKKILSQKKVDTAFIQAELATNKEKIDKIKSLFINESSFINFLAEKDGLVKEGKVTDFSVSDVPVFDKAKNSGYAILIEIKGTPYEVSETLVKVENLPFLMLPASLEVDVAQDEVKTTTVKYIGMLYLK